VPGLADDSAHFGQHRPQVEQDLARAGRESQLAVIGDERVFLLAPGGLGQERQEQSGD